MHAQKKISVRCDALIQTRLYLQVATESKVSEGTLVAYNWDGQMPKKQLHDQLKINPLKGNMDLLLLSAKMMIFSAQELHKM